MRFGAAALAITLLLTGCGGRTAEPEHAEEKSAPSAKHEPDSVTMLAEAQKNAGLEFVETAVREVPQGIRAGGKLVVNEDRTWSVDAHIEGRVVEIFAKVGDSVKRGMVLAHVHGHDVHDSRADYRRATDELVRARAAAVQARTIRDRAVRLLEMKAGSRQEVEHAEGGFREAQAAVRNAETEVARVRVHMTEYLNVPVREPGSAAGEHDDEVPVRTPGSGIVLDRKVSAGVVVSSGQPMFRISDPSTLWMIANVAETDLSGLRVGQDVVVEVRAYPDRRFRGRILRLGEGLNPETRTLQVRVLVPNPQGLLKPEMYATATVESAASRKAVLIPEDAIQDLNGSDVVFVQTDATHFQPRPVRTGERSGGAIEVVAGLRAGERVVTKGSFIVKSHMLRSSLQEDH